MRKTTRSSLRLAAVEVVPHIHRQKFIQNILQRGNRFLKQFRQRLTQSLSPRKNIQQTHEPSYEHQCQSRRGISV